MPSGKSRKRSSAARSTPGRRTPKVPTLDASAFERILAGKGEMPSTIYLAGRDEAAKKEAIERIKERWSQDQPSTQPIVHRASEAGVAQVLADAQGGSLFSPVIFVEVLNVEEWERSSRTIDAAAEGITRVPAGNLLLLIESGGDNERKSLVPLRAASQVVVQLDGLSAEELARWGLAHLERLGVEADPDAMEAVLEATRLETGEVMNELDKLAAWAGEGGKITRQDTDQVLRPVLTGRLAALSRAIAEGRGDHAVDQFLRALEAGEREGNVLFQLETLVSGAIRLKSGQWGWIRDRDNSSRLSRRLSEDELSQRLDLLYRVELAWKSGRGDARTLLLRAVVGLSETRLPVLSE